MYTCIITQSYVAHIYPIHVPKNLYHSVFIVCFLKLMILNYGKYKMSILDFKNSVENQ